MIYKFATILFALQDLIHLLTIKRWILKIKTQILNVLYNINKTL